MRGLLAASGVWWLAAIAGCTATRSSVVSEPARVAGDPVAAVAPAPHVDPPQLDRIDQLISGLARDPRLDLVAAAAASTAADGYVISAWQVHDTMIASLATDLPPYVLAARGSDDAVVEQLSAAIATLRGSVDVARVGLARARGPTGQVVAVIVVPSPDPEAVVRRDVDRDRARIAVAWSGGEPLAAYAALPGRTHRLAIIPAAGGVEVELDCVSDRGATVEVDAAARTIASVVAACGPPPPTDRAAIDIGPEARTAVEYEQRLFELMVRERVAQGRGPLRWDPTAARIARAHSEDMARDDYVGHIGKSGDTLNDRVTYGRLPAFMAFENVGHAAGPGEVHDAFLASPGHRKNLLQRDAQAGAVGVAVDPRDPTQYYVTELLFAPEAIAQR